MKKVIIAIVAVVMFTACGNNNVETKPSTTDSTTVIDTTSVKDTVAVVSEGNGGGVTNGADVK